MRGLSSQLTGKLRQEDCKARLGYSMSSRELGETISQNKKHKGGWMCRSAVDICLTYLSTEFISILKKNEEDEL